MIYGVLNNNGIKRGSCWTTVREKYDSEEETQKEVKTIKGHVRRLCGLCHGTFYTPNGTYKDQNILCPKCRLPDEGIRSQYERMQKHI